MLSDRVDAEDERDTDTDAEAVGEEGGDSEKEPAAHGVGGVRRVGREVGVAGRFQRSLGGSALSSTDVDACATLKGAFGNWGLGFRAWGWGFRVSGFGFRVSGFGFRVSGFGFVCVHKPKYAHRW
jgi:hypothetical protein